MPTPEDASSIRPALTEVGAVLRARTRSDVTGGQIGTFNASTSPTGDEVDEFITDALTEVELRLPVDLAVLTDRQVRYVQRLVARRAAMDVELSLEPDRVGEGDSAYNRLRDAFESGMTALADALEDSGSGGDEQRAFSVPISTVTAQYSAPFLPEDYLDDQVV